MAPKVSTVGEAQAAPNNKGFLNHEQMVRRRRKRLQAMEGVLRLGFRVKSLDASPIELLTRGGQNHHKKIYCLRVPSYKFSQKNKDENKDEATPRYEEMHCSLRKYFFYHRAVKEAAGGQLDWCHR